MRGQQPAPQPADTLEIREKYAIQELSARYAYHIDHFELDALLDLWVDDAVLDERPVGLYRFEGIDQIRHFFQTEFKVRTKSAHLMANHLIEMTALTAARGSCYCRVESDLRSGQAVQATVTYTDEYVHRGGRWLFKSRVVRPLGQLELGDIAEDLATELGKP